MERTILFQDEIDDPEARERYQVAIEALRAGQLNIEIEIGGIRYEVHGQGHDRANRHYLVAEIVRS